MRPPFIFAKKFDKGDVIGYTACHMSHKKEEQEEEDISIEAELGDAESGAFKDPHETIKKLKEKLKSCEAERKEYLDGWQRMKADLVNYKKDEEKRHGTVREYATEHVLADLLKVEESFQMAFGNKEAWESVSPEWRKGVEYIHSQFMSVLADHGISLIEPQKGESFDPAVHESVGTVPVSDAVAEGSVQESVKRGYRLRERVLKPAQVKVGACENINTQ